MEAEETPITTPDASAETPAPEVKAYDPRTSHLANVRLPVAEDEGDGASSAADPELKLPKTLKASHELLVELQNQTVTNKTEAEERQAKITKVTAHIHELSQGPKPPVFTNKSHTELASSASAHAEAIHLKLICQTDRIVAKRLASDEAKIAELTKALKASNAKIAELTKK